MNTTKENKLPRMRTIPNAAKEIKQLDPNTNITKSTLYRLVNNGTIPYISIDSRRLINLDLLIESLSCYNENAIHASN